MTYFAGDLMNFFKSSVGFLENSGGVYIKRIHLEIYYYIFNF